MDTDKKIKVFVSYSRHDEDKVKPLASLLGVATDEIVFLDVTSVEPGDDWKTRIEDAVREASVFVLCWCCASQASEFVAHEISIATESKDKRLVPVLFCSTPLPPLLAAKQWIDLRGQIVHLCNGHETANFNEPPVELLKKEDISPRALTALTRFAGGGESANNSRLGWLLALVAVAPLLVPIFGPISWLGSSRTKARIAAAAVKYFLELDKS
ncbi:MAG: toll/interleukin-1 receptor domain-containing protein [Terriglobales bacterium]